MNKREKIALGLAIAGLVWLFAEQTYFRWNINYTSPANAFCNAVTYAAWIIAFFIRPTKTVTEVTNINTQTVEIIKPTVKLNKRNKKDLTN